MMHIHRWGPWKMTIATYARGPLGKRIGLPPQWDEQVQVRTCGKCGKLDLRNLVAS